MAKGYINEGSLVPDHIVLDMLKEHVKELGRSRGEGGVRLLLDGFPRTVSQAVEMKKLLPVHCVFVLDIPHATIVDRISNRTIHPPSGRIYNKTYNPEKNPGYDDVTGEPLGTYYNINVYRYMYIYAWRVF